MTTKQVKKAYQKANKVPRISKAEQRRIELFEQDRIRKEFEKERNQARARAARDKKKEREERERAEKKKKGLPLVDVRPSQDTIARFVRGKSSGQRDDSASSTAIAERNGDEGHNWSLSPPATYSGNYNKKQKIDDTNKENARPIERTESSSTPSYAIAEDNGHGLDDESPIRDHAGPPNKKLRIDIPDEEDEAPLPIVNRATLPDQKVAVAGLNSGAKPTEPTIDDSFSTIDFNEDDLLEGLFREEESVHSSGNVLNKGKSEQRQDQNPPIDLPWPNPPENRLSSLQEAEKPLPCLEQVARPTEALSHPHQASLTSKSVPDATKSLQRNSMLVPEKQIATPQSIVLPPTMVGNSNRPDTSQLEKPQEDASSTRHPQLAASSAQAFRHPRTPIAPPPGPPKSKLANSVSADQPRMPQFLKSSLPPVHTMPRKPSQSHITKPIPLQESNLPPSTQLFILSHLDDFLPSPSQEIREIFEEPRRKDTGIQYESPLFCTYSNHVASKWNPYRNLNPTTPNNRNANATLATTPWRLRHVQQSVQRVESRVAALQPPLHTTPTAFEMPFFSTQDLVLSSQDVKDIEEEPLPPYKAQRSVQLPSKPINEPLENKRLEDLPVQDTDDEKEDQKTDVPSVAASKPDIITAMRESSARTIQFHAKTTPETQLSNCAQPTASSRIRQRPSPIPDSIPSSIPEERPILSNHDHSRKPSDAQGQGQKAGSSKTQQNSKPKSSSYEAMLELLAQGPRQSRQRIEKSAQDHSRVSVNKNRYGGKLTVTGDQNPISTAEEEQAMITIPASQETDYDSGEDLWDDDDLLRDMI
jgi:hypothetical protein